MSIDDIQITESPDSQTTEAPVSNEVQVQSVEVQPESIPFMESLPQAVRDLPVFKDVADADAFVSKIQELHKNIEVPEEYDLSVPREEDGGELFELFKATAKQANLTQDQATKMNDMWNGLSEKVKQKREQELATTVHALQQEWGKDYDSKLGSAKKALNHFGGETLTKYLDSTGLGNNKNLIETFYAVSVALEEDNAVGIQSSKAPKDVDRWHGMGLLDFKM